MLERDFLLPLLVFDVRDDGCEIRGRGKEN